MNYIINRIKEGKEELILNYKDETSEVERIISFINSCNKRIIGKCNGNQIIVNPADILYVEVFDEKTYVYTLYEEIKVDFSLYQLEQLLNGKNFFRCSKSVIVNIDKIEKLKSLSSNRIDALMIGGEHILISRTYASEFRKVLKEGINER